MKKIILALAFSASLTGFAEAQTSRNPCYTTGAQTTQGIPNCISVGTSTPLPVVTTTTTGAPLDVEGNVASGAADSGNPVKVGGRYNATQPVPVDGQRLDFQMSPGGQLYVSNAMTQLTGVDGFSNAQIGYPVSSSSGAIGSRLIQNVGPSFFNGTTWDRQFTCPNSAVVNVTNGTTGLIVALTASQIIRVCSIVLTSTAATTATVSYGTQTTNPCDTGNTALTGAMNIATSPLTISSSNGSLMRTAASNALCIAAGAVTVTGFVTYAKY